MINHGIQQDQTPRPTDYQVGGFSFVSYEARNKNGDWRPYLPTKEIQFGKEDSLSCVSFSACNAIEIQEKFLTGKETNYSDRWIAKRSGTTHEGNWLYKVGDTVRHDGLVPEESYPAPPNYTFDEYHADIPEPLLSSLVAQGKDFLSRWDIRTEFVPATKEEMVKHLKHAPLQIVIPGHAIVNFLCEDDVVNYFDTYEPNEKTIGYSMIQAAYKYVLTPKTMTKRFIIKDGDKLGVLTLEGFTGTAQFCDNFADWPEFKKLLKVDDSTLTINIPQ